MSSLSPPSLPTPDGWWLVALLTSPGIAPLPHLSTCLVALSMAHRYTRALLCLTNSPLQAHIYFSATHPCVDSPTHPCRHSTLSTHVLASVPCGARGCLRGNLSVPASQELTGWEKTDTIHTPIRDDGGMPRARISGFHDL